MNDNTSQSIQNEYTTLISLTQQFFLQEYPQNGQINVNPSSYTLYKDFLTQPSTRHPRAVPSSNQKANSSSQPPLPNFAPPNPVPPPPPSTKNSVPINANPLKPAVESPLKETKKTEEPSPPPLKNDLKTPFQLEKLPPPKELEIKEFMGMIKTHFPHIRVQDSVAAEPIENKALPTPQKVSSIPPVVILSFYSDQPSQTFLTNLAQAIEKQGIPARVFSAFKINQEGKWDALLDFAGLRLILASPEQIQTFPSLLKHYQTNNPQFQKLKAVDLLPIRNPTDYLKDPQLKSPLWKITLKALSEIVSKKG